MILTVAITYHSPCINLIANYSPAVKCKSFVLKVWFLQMQQLFFLFKLAWKSTLIKFYKCTFS